MRRLPSVPPYLFFSYSLRIPHLPCPFPCFSHRDARYPPQSPPPPRDDAMERRTTAFVAAAPGGRFGAARVGHVTGARGRRGGVLPATRRCRAVVTASAVTQVDHDGLEAALKNDSTTPLLVDFYAPWYVADVARFACIAWYLTGCRMRWGEPCRRG